MVAVKCVNCGKEYRLSEGEDPKNFLCDCGGNLEERRRLKDVRRLINRSNEYSKDVKMLRLPLRVKKSYSVGVIK